LLLRPTFLQAVSQFQLNVALSLAVAEALQFSLEQPIKLKWPNDVLVGDKKIGGILIENQLQGTSIASAIAGIGININQENFSHHKATSLCRLTGTTLPLDDIFQRLMKSIELAYLALRAGKADIQKEHYLASLYKFNELHAFEAKGSEFNGSITDITESGKLCIESNGKTREFSLQEVRFLG
jgi:BirA family biotin operon repressor/biotin-[acetyl-CoA-carboxylase] ligase